jgi:hypothetical protein
MRTRSIRAAALKLAKADLGVLHKRLAVVQEHGQWWIACNDCGAQWAVYEAQSVFGETLEFEPVSYGNGDCS